MQINVAVTDANNIVCEVVPPQVEVITIDRGVAGNGIVSIVPVTISTFQYLRITYTNGTVQDVGPLTSTAYTATAPITIVGNTISLATVPIASGGTDATTAAGAIQNLLPSYTGNANKRLGLNSGGTALEWVLDGGGTVTSVAASGGTTGLTFTGSPITTSGTLTLGGTLAVANGGTGVTSSSGANSVMLRDANQNVVINAVDDGYVNFAASGTTTTLTVSSARRYTVTGSGGQTFKLPDATTLVNGAIFEFDNNQSSGAILVNNNSNTLIVSVPSGGIVRVDLLSNATAAGSWDRHDLTPSNVSWSTNTFDYAGSITSATWNGTTVQLNRGGTGQTTAQAAMNSFAGAVTSGSYLRGNGTNVVMSTIQAADVPTLNQNTIGTAANVTGVVAIANGGTGQITANAALNALLPTQTGNASKYLQTDGTNATWDAISLSTADITGILPTANGGTGLSSFTSGGVVYASSTSALTTGSVLTFNGTSLSLTGSSGLFNALAGANFRLQNSAATANWYLETSGLDFQTRTSQAGSIKWLISDAEQMRLTSTGLGIGTSSPAVRLDVAGGSSADVISIRGRTSDNFGLLSFATSSGTKNSYIGSTDSTNLTFYTNGFNERARIDSNGNFGVGITDATQKIQTNGRIRVTSNGTNGGDMAVDQGGLAFSSLGATPIVFERNNFGNESARFDGSGNLGIGTTSPASALYVKRTSGNSGIYTDYNGTNVGRIEAASNGNLYIGITTGSGDIAIGNTANTSVVNLTSAGNVGISTSSPAQKLDVNGTAQALRFISTSSSASLPSYAVESGSGIFNAGASTIGFSVGSSEQMRLTSTGLGIGTSSPLSKLDARATNATMGNYQTIQAFTTDTATVDYGGGISLGGNYSGTSSLAQFASIAGRKENGTSGNYAGYLQFGTNSQATGVREVMRLDSSGNLGLGVTPSAWTTYKAMQINSGGGVMGTTTGTSLIGNWYYNSGYKYSSTGSATLFDTSSGSFQWYTAPSGTAGNAITFTQAMTLDASGNWQLGTTTNPDSARLRVYGVSEIDGNGVGLLKFKSSGTVVGSAGQGNYVVSGGPADGYGIQSATSLVFGSGGTTERARITSTGSLLIGATSAFNGELLQVSRAGTVSTTDFIYSSAPTALIQTPNNGVDNKAVLMLRAAYTDGSFSAGSISVKTDAQYRGQMVITYDADPSGGYLAFNQFYPTSAATYERARFNPYGYLGITTSSPNTKLDIRGTSNTAESTIQIVGNSVSTLLLGQNADGGVIRGQGGNNVLSFWTGGLGDTGAGLSGSEKARIDSSGNLIIGATSTRASSKLDVRGDVMTLGSNGSYYATISYDAGAGFLSLAAESGGGLKFLSGTSEKARITSSGQLLVGTTLQATGTSTVSERGYASTGNGALVQNRTGGYLGSVTNLVLFTRGNSSAQAWAFITISTIYATPSAFVSRTVVMVRGDMTYSVISQVGENSNGYNAISFSVSGNDFRVSNSNGSIYFSIECELGSPNNASYGWNATWGSSW
jgi:hypothetical protein